MPPPLPFTVEVYENRGTWLEHGRGIGSSDAPTIMGYGYESSLELWGRLTGKIPKGADNDNLRFRFGRAAEGFIHEETERELGTTLINPGAWTVWRNRARPWQTSTLDRVVTDPDREIRTALRRAKRTPEAALERLVRSGVVRGPAEFKTISGFAVNGRGRDELSGWGEEPPAHVLLQVQHQLLTTGMPEAWVVGLVGSGDDLLTYRVAAHEGLQARLLEEEERFWRLVQEDRPPALDGSDKTRAALSLMFPQDTGAELVLGPEFVSVHQRLQLAKEREAAAKECRQRAEAELKLAMGDASKALIQGLELTIGDDGAADVRGKTVAAYSWRNQSRTDPPRPEPRTTTFRVFREIKP